MYLVYKINQNHIDPLPLYHECGPLRAMLLRDELTPPDQAVGESDAVYCERLRQVLTVLIIWGICKFHAVALYTAHQNKTSLANVKSSKAVCKQHYIASLEIL